MGVSDLATGAPIGVVDKVRIASITKTFVGTAVLQLVDDGRLTLDDRLDRYVPDIANGDRITIRELLNMTAGVYNYVEDEAFLAAYDADPLLPFTPRDALAIIRRHEPYFAPGTAFHYSDSQYILLGLIIEQLTGQPLHEVIQQRVVAPLGLSSTSFPPPPPLPAQDSAASPASSISVVAVACISNAAAPAARRLCWRPATARLPPSGTKI